MRGTAALLAALAAWTVAGGALYLRAPALPRPEPRAVVAALVAGAGTALLTLGLVDALAVAVAAGILAAAIPFWTAGARTSRRRAAVADAWPDFLAILRSHLAAGSSLPEAFTRAARRAHPALAAILTPVDDRLAGGASFGDCLAELPAEFHDPVADRVLATLAAAHRSGGPRVAAILAALGASVADELRLRKAHEAALTQQRLTAAVALVAPWGLLLLTVATNPQAAAVYATSSGAAVVVGGLAATGLGYVLARRTARLTQPPRIFGTGPR